MMKQTVLIITIFAAFLAGAEAPKTFTGAVTDTMCGAKPHSSMMKDKSDAECVRLCARGPNAYALYDGTAVMKLSDQKTPARYAGQQVKVIGVYDQKNKTLKVASIEPGTK